MRNDRDKEMAKTTEVNIKIGVDCTELDKAIEKAKSLLELLQQAQADNMKI